jgi:transposase
MTYYAALDVSLKFTAVCIMDSAGTIKHEAMVPTNPDDLIVYLRSPGVEYVRIGLEAGSLTPWLYHAMIEAGLPMVCMETRHAKAVLKVQGVKTDKNDARSLAQMMRTGWFKAVHIKSKESQRIRVLLNNRKCLASKRIDIENQIRGTLKVFGLKAGRVTAAQYEPRIRELIGDDHELQGYIFPLLESRRVMREQGRILDKQVRNIAAGDEVCRRLMTVPGVGPVIALMYKATIDNPHRFTKSNTVGAHLGLTPGKYASGEVDYDGHITRCGDEMMRAHLFEAAQVLLTRSAKWSALRAWGLQIAKRRSMKIACVAVARKLAVVLHRMWVDNTTFRFSAREVAA